jgi:ankyrin repeat protein
MKRRISFLALLACGLLLTLVTVPLVLTWQTWRQERLNQSLIHAVHYEDTQAVVSLLRQGADPNTRDIGRQPGSIWTFLRETWMQPGRSRSSPSTANQSTVLMTAADLADAEIVKALLASGADPNRKDQYGGSAAMWAGGRELTYEGKTEAQYRDTLHALLEAGADVNAHFDDGTTLLMQAVQHRNNRLLLQEVLAHHPDVNAVNDVGETAVERAMCSDNLPLVRFGEQAEVHFVYGKNSGLT